MKRTIQLREKYFNNNEIVMDIFCDGILAGSLEANYRPSTNSFYIENIRKDKDYTGKGLLKKVIKHLLNMKMNIECLPLVKYRKYYEELGFKPYFKHNEDVFYLLKCKP